MQLSALRFGITNLLLALNIVLLLIGGIGLTAGYIVALLLMTVIDELFGDINEDVVPAPARLLDAMLVLTLPLIALNSILFACYFSSAEHTWIGGLLSSIGIDFDAARRSSTTLDIIGAASAVGVIYGWGMNVAHELVHRTTDRFFSACGRWLSAFSIESAFNLQHMTGHHINVGIYEDSGTSRRGESVYAFVLRASIGNNLFAFRSERDRLQRRALPFWSLRNQFLTGQAMSLAIAAVFYACGGWLAVGAFLLVGLLGRFYLEAAAYVEHYGLVRVPGTRFEARHSWNSYRSLSNGMLYNVERHSHHHLFAGKPFYRLTPDEGAPVLPHGYMTMFAFSLIPPLFDRIMRPSLANWDLNYATEAERRYVVEKGKHLWLPQPAE